MMETTVLAILLFAALLGILSLGVWIAFALLAVAIIAVTLFAPVAAGQIMALTIWGSSGSWSLVAMPMFLWMGEILFRTRLSEDMFGGLAPLVTRIPGRLMHINVLGCGIMAAVVGSSSVTCATIGRISLPELASAAMTREWPSHAGRLRPHGAADPAVDHDDRLRRGRPGVDRPDVRGGRPAGPDDDRPVHVLRRRLEPGFPDKTPAIPSS